MFPSISGVTEQLGVLSNLAAQGPPGEADRSTKVCQISNIKTVFLSAKSSLAQHIKTFITGVYGSILMNEGTFAQETYWGQWLKLNDCEASYTWGTLSGKFFEPCSLEYQKTHLSLSFYHRIPKKDGSLRHDMLPKETF